MTERYACAICGSGFSEEEIVPCPGGYSAPENAKIRIHYTCQKCGHQWWADSGKKHDSVCPEKDLVADILLHDPEIRHMIRDAIIEEAKHKSN